MLSGASFRQVRSVQFGTGHRTLYLPLTTSLILALAPPQASGSKVDVTVTTARGTGATSAADVFTCR